jgi:Undecaprenyl-phosphate glucose phosphotransferase
MAFDTASGVTSFIAEVEGFTDMHAMNTASAVSGGYARQSHRRKVSRDFVHLAVDLLTVADFASLMIAGYITAITLGYPIPHLGTGESLWVDYAHKTFMLAVLGPFLLYDRQFRYAGCSMPLETLLQRTLRHFLWFCSVVLALGFATRSTNFLPRSLLAMWLGSSLILVLVSRVLLISYLKRLERKGVLSETIAVVGAGPVADRLIRQLLQSRPEGMDIVGVFDDRIRDEDAQAVRDGGGTFLPIGTIPDLLHLGKTRKIDWVLVTLPCTAEQRLLSILHSLKTLAVPVGLCPENVGLDLPYRGINYVGDGVPVSLLADRPIRSWNAVIKGIEDLLFAGLFTLLLLPVMAIIALAIRIDSEGPILFRQRRHGTNNDVFDCLKFRTMRWEPGMSAARLEQTRTNDDRITRVGRLLRKSSLDELPQLFNVLRGEMSLVGPRPHAVNMRTEEQLGHEIIDAYPHRHRVKPGITGWAQVNGSRGATETVEQLRHRVEMDLYYVENWSLLFDLKILFMTLWVVVRGVNAR